MTAPARDPRASDGAGALGFDALAAASSFLSSRWSRDNLITSFPGRLYDGRVLELIDFETVGHLLEDLAARSGPLETRSGRMGVFTWDILCESAEGPLLVQVPRALDEPGRRQRAKRDVPRKNVETMRAFIERGLGRYVLEPRELVTLAGDVPAATFRALTDHHPITFGRGSIQVELSDGARSFLIPLGPSATAELLAEMIAALVYHYDPELDGGTALTDLCVNDGDFVVKRQSDGSFALRLTAARRLESGIGKNLLLLYLVQLMAYEDFNVGDDLTGVPVLLSNPSVAFEGVVRGLRYRYRDTGRSEDDGASEALRWIRDFGHSPEGRCYRPWVDRYLDGRLPLVFGADPRERWWHLMPLFNKLGVLELRALREPSSEAAHAARTLRTFVERLSRENGRILEEELGSIRINDLGRDALVALLAEAGVAADTRAELAEALLARWPYRNLDHLLAEVPAARGLRRLKSRIAFGRVLSETEQGTLKSLPPLPKDGGTGRPLANPEVFGPVLSPSLCDAALQTFPTFEAYMDAALHDRDFGYYAHRVVIGRTGHFDTHPESFSPRYGEWIARAAFATHRELVRSGALAPESPFPLIELGAGNGRLARDIIDAIARFAREADPAARDAWRRLAERLDYRVYEISASLREKQRALLGADARVVEGDARSPGAALARDFPNGVTGFVVTNEVPDAFGVHKLAITADGRAFAALVVPRAEPSLCNALGEALSLRAAAADAAVRATFGFSDHAEDRYLDAETYAAAMKALFALPPEQRNALLAGSLWFEEVYVPATALPELAAHLATNAADYATALAAEDSGVVLYVNTHADRFIRELGSALRAGAIVTIDYGETAWGLVQGARRGDFPFRVYGEWQDYVPRPNDPYSAPGTQDMTADVNFTALANAGREAGLEVLHFGPERDVTGEALSRLLDEAAHQNTVFEFLGNPLFKVLVLGKGASTPFTGPLLSPLALAAREQDVPKSRRPRIPRIQKALTDPASNGS